MYTQIWMSVNASLPYTGNEMGRTLNGRRLIRMITDAEPNRLVEILSIRGYAPVILGVQLPDGSDYDAEKYPRNVKDYAIFMAQLNIFNNGLQIVDQTANTGAGWEPFNLGV